jgi:hypothetical protein
MNRDQLLEVLDKFGVPTFQHDTASGATLVAIQRGARLIGMFPCREGKCANALWVNPSIETILGNAASDWAGEGAGGMGGDRLWISPERNFYYKKPREFADWFAQRDMDPGSYELTEKNGGLMACRNSFNLKDWLNGRILKNVAMARSLFPIEDPPVLAGTPGEVLGRLSFVGVASTEQIEAPAPKRGAAPLICPWGLTQVAPPRGDCVGTVVAPTARRAEPVHYFGPIDPDRLKVFDDYAAFRIDSRKIAKLGLRPEDLAPQGPVRIAYLKPVAPEVGPVPAKAETWLMLVRESQDVTRTSEGALDPAKADPDGPRGVIQSYNHDASGAARFGEIEMQYLPVRRCDDGVWRSTVKSRLLAFVGKKSDVLAAASDLLGLECIDLFE